ncbi:MAG: hypothetical protein E6J04_14560 [Chloroflexi bacterium]|nr:MAG: hypothetical protein E6J04_14560 [Chloroflexota bacterium]
MALPSQETITILALDRHQQPVFRVRSISGGLNQNFLDDAVAFGQHLLKLEPEVVLVEVYDSPTDTLSSEKPLFIIKRDDPSDTGQQLSGSPPRWVRALVGLILGSSFPS